MFITTDLTSTSIPSSFLTSVFVFPDLPREPIPIQNVESLQYQCNYKVLLTVNHQTTIQEIKNQIKVILGKLYPNLFPYLYSTIDEVSFQTIHKNRPYLLFDSLHLSSIQPLPCDLYLLLGVPQFHHDMFLSSSSSSKESNVTDILIESSSNSEPLNQSQPSSISPFISEKKESLKDHVSTIPSSSSSSSIIEQNFLDTSIEFNKTRTTEKSLTSSTTSTTLFTSTTDTTHSELNKNDRVIIDKEPNQDNCSFTIDMHSEKGVHSSISNVLTLSSSQDNKKKLVDLTSKKKGIEKENLQPKPLTKKETKESKKTTTITTSKPSSKLITKEEQSMKNHDLKDLHQKETTKLNSNPILSTTHSSNVEPNTSSHSTLKNILPNTTNTTSTTTSSLSTQACDTTPSTLDPLPVTSSSPISKPTLPSSLHSILLSVSSQENPQQITSSKTLSPASVQSSSPSLINNKSSSLIPEHLQRALNLISSSTETTVSSTSLFSSSTNNNNNSNEEEGDDSNKHSEKKVQTSTTLNSSSMVQYTHKSDSKTSLLSMDATPNSNAFTLTTEVKTIAEPTKKSSNTSNSNSSIPSTQSVQENMESNRISEHTDLEKVLVKGKKETITPSLSPSSTFSSLSSSTLIPSVSPLLPASMTPTLDSVKTTPSPSLSSSILNDVPSTPIHPPSTPISNVPSKLSSSMALPSSTVSPTLTSESSSSSLFTSNSVSSYTTPSTPPTSSLSFLPTPSSSSTAALPSTTSTSSFLPHSPSSSSSTLLTPSTRPTSLSFKPSNAPSLKAMLNSGALQRLKAMPSFSSSSSPSSSLTPLSQTLLSGSFTPNTSSSKTVTSSSPHLPTSTMHSGSRKKRPRSDSEDDSEDSTSSSDDESSDSSSDDDDDDDDDEENRSVFLKKDSNNKEGNKILKSVHMSDDSDFEEVRPQRSVPKYVKSKSSSSKRKKRSLLGSLSQG